MRIFAIILTIAGGLWLVGCGSGGGGSGTVNSSGGSGEPAGGTGGGQEEVVQVSGRVLDSANSAVPGATVTITSPLVVVSTDDMGGFVALVSPGEHELTVEKDGVIVCRRSFTAALNSPSSLGELVPTLPYYGEYLSFVEAYSPHRQGYSWEYSQTFLSGTVQTVAIEVISSDQSRWVVESTAIYRSGSQDNWSDRRFTTVYEISGGLVSANDADYYYIGRINGGSLNVDTATIDYSPPLLSFVAGPTVGATNERTTVSTHGGEWSGTYTNTHIYEVLGFETVVVPAGVFVDALKIKHTSTGSSAESNEVLWFAKGIGLVRILRNNMTEDVLVKYYLN